MKFAYSTSIYRLRSLSEAVEGIARAGFCAIELIAERPHAFPEDMTATHITALNESLEQLKMKISNLNSCWATTSGDVRSSSWIEENWQPRETRIRYTLDCMRMAAAIGIPLVTTEGAGVLPSTMNHKDGVRLFVANLHRVFPLAARLGVKLLVQPEPGLLIETSDQMLELLKEIDFNESMGVNFDAGHFYCAGEDPCEAWEKLKKYVLHVHLEDVPADRQHRHIQLGEGAMDIPGFLQCVQESDYEGYITIKLDSYEQRPEEIVMASALYLRERGFLPQSVEPCLQESGESVNQLYCKQTRIVISTGGRNLCYKLREVRKAGSFAELKEAGMVVDERPDLASFRAKAGSVRQLDVFQGGRIPLGGALFFLHALDHPLQATRR